MPFNPATFQQHITAANAHFKRHKGSSLDPLLAALTTVVQGIPAPAQIDRIRDTVGRIPYGKQLKYQAALSYLLTSIGLNALPIPYAYPVALRHRFSEFNVGAARWNNGTLNRPDGWFHHVFEVSWSSSNGNMASLASIWNRERVAFQQDPAGPPYVRAIMANTPRTYEYGINGSSDGGRAEDDHYFMHPDLMCKRPLQNAAVSALQQYEYSPDAGASWYTIEGGNFVFEKGVRGNVFYFSKRNDAGFNPRPYHFEVEYAIGPAPNPMPANYNEVWGRALTNPAALGQYAARIIAQQ